MTKRRWLFWACFYLGVCLPASIQADAVNHIRHVELSRQGEGYVIEIVGEQAPNFTTFKQDSPRRVIVDIAESRVVGVPAAMDGQGGLVESVRVRQIGKASESVARVMISLSSEIEYRIGVRGGTLLVYIMPGVGGLLVSAGVPLGPSDGAGFIEGGSTSQKPTDEVNLTSVASGSHMHAHDRALADDLSGVSVKKDKPEQDPRPRVNPDSRPVPARRSKIIETASMKPDALPADGISRKPVDEIRAEDRPVPAPVLTLAQADSAQQEPAADSADENTQERLFGSESDQNVDQVAEQDSLESEVEVESSPADNPPNQPASSQTISDSALDEGQNIEVEERVEMSTAIKHMTWVGFQQTADVSRVFVKTNAPVSYRVVEEGDSLVVLELDNTVIPLRNNRRFLDTTFFESAVAMVVPREVGGVGQRVRIEIQLKHKVPFQTGREENMVFVNFDRPR